MADSGSNISSSPLEIANATHCEHHTRTGIFLLDAEDQLCSTISPPASPSKTPPASPSKKTAVLQTPTKQSRASTPAVHSSPLKSPTFEPRTPRTKIQFMFPTLSPGSTTDGTDKFIPGAVYTPVKTKNHGSSQCNERLYIVYWGKDDCDGIFTEWYGEGGAQEATSGSGSWYIHCHFLDPEIGHKAYQDCQKAGILKALKLPAENSKMEWFLVIVSECPGIYHRQGVMKNGLGYCSGQICHVDRSYSDTEALFKAKKEKGEVKILESWHIM
ncbi:hypothetical protein GYMLUDRAFT_60428 [Collybiopsis luxurians FD-317 M1]|uniref:Uncharacterized protein n=1 Tax=Collybiopsis luxurians FD-317 M1 TaxID=944289 RepID=A0A0D0CKF2_9AGAR|nr:hypothetical protein GYMLUDRAFT_60428 [Collybiopsis luxurians FD-317 M1]